MVLSAEMDPRLSSCMFTSLYSLVQLVDWLNKENFIAILCILLAMALPITAKLGSFALLVTGSLLVGTLLYLILVEHNHQIESLQSTILHMCLVAMEREHIENLNLDD